MVYNVGQGLQNRLIKTDPNSIYSLTKALDNLALAEMKSFYQIKDLSEEKIQSSLTALKNIRTNLENHDQVIQAFNNSFHTGFLSCPDHLKTIALITNLQTSLLNASFNSLQNLINNGLKVDRFEASEIYSRMEKLIQQLDPKGQKDHLKKLNTMLNKAYMSTIIDQVSDQRNPIPTSISLLFEALGLGGEDLSKIQEEKRPQLLDKLKQRLADDQQMNALNIFDLIDLVQQDLILVAVSEIPNMKEMGLIPILNKLYQFETHVKSLQKNAEKKARELILEKVNRHESTALKKALTKKVQAFSFSPPASTLFLQLGNALAIKPKMSPKDIKEQLQKLDQLIDAEKAKLPNETEFLNNIYPEIATWFSKIDLQKCYLWFENNLKATKFEFDQSQWGEQEVFGNGVCMAINYRWIKSLMADPNKNVKGPQDFQEQMSEQAQQLYKSETGISAKDRIAQATYALGRRYGKGEEESNLGIGSTILKRDHLTHEDFVFEMGTIKKTIDMALQEQKKKGLSTGGIFDIGAKGKNMGHAMGMQINDKDHIYQFWDVNTGFYQYDSLEEMKNAFSQYLDDFYDGKFIMFRIGQYKFT